MCNEHGSIAKATAVIECPAPTPRPQLPAVGREHIPAARTQVDLALKTAAPVVKALPPVTQPTAPVVTPPPAASKVVTPPQQPVTPASKAVTPPPPAKPAAPAKIESADKASTVIEFLASLPKNKPEGGKRFWYFGRLCELLDVTVAKDRPLSNQHHREGRIRCVTPKLRAMGLLDQTPKWILE